jgi:hypothetical protein
VTRDIDLRLEFGARTTSDSGWHAQSACEYLWCQNPAFHGDYSPVLATLEALLARRGAFDRGGPDATELWSDAQQVERWRAQQLTAEAAKLTIYRAFIEGDLDVPRHLARRVHEL